MRSIVTINKERKVVSVAWPDPEQNDKEPTIRSGPVLEDGDKEIVLDLPDEYVRISLEELMQRVEVDLEKRGLHK